MRVGIGKPFSAVVVSLCVLVGGLVFASAPALAATPETPTVTVESVAPTTATFHGVLNPAATEQVKVGMGTYKFLYKASSKECTGGKETSPSGLSLGGPHEEVFEPVMALTPGTEYMVCLSVTNLESQTAVSAPVPFTTNLPPEKPVTKSPAASITATTATLEGTLNPLKAGEAGSYEVYYQQSASECNPEHVAPEPAGVMSGAAKQGVSVPVRGLEPSTEYTFCVVAINKAGEVAIGNAVPFKTSVSKPTIINESAEPKAEEARLSATVNPSNESTECHFEYGETAVAEHVVACEQGTPPGTLTGGEQGVAVTVTGLKQKATYKYDVLLKNATGSGEGTEEEFTTAIHPETPAGVKAESITTTTATLAGVLNPGAPGNPGSYEFVYRQSASECEIYSDAYYRLIPVNATPTEPATGAKLEPAEAILTELLPNTTYTFCLSAHNEVGEESTLSAPVTFTTPPAAVEIKSEGSSGVAATEARLEAEIYDGNSSASYHFEYGPAAGDYTVSIPVPSGELAAHVTGVDVSAVAVGLQPGTTYHWRVVASNALPGEVDGSDQEFTTPGAHGTGSPSSCPNEKLRAEQPYGLKLPDCRAYEMVSPVEKNGNDATDPNEETATSRASVSGEALVFTSHGSFAGPVGAQYENQFLSRRGPEGWTTQSITAPFNDYNLAPYTSPFQNMAFTPELTMGVETTDASLKTNEAVEAPVGQFAIYLDEFASGSYRWVSKDAPLIPYQDGETEPYRSSLHWYSWYQIMGHSTDLSHVVFDDESNEEVYEWIDGKVVDVSVGNYAEPIGGAVVGRSVEGGGEAGSERAYVWNAVSADGSRVFFGSGEKLYVRENAEREQSPMESGRCTVSEDACTVEIAAGGARYWGASADGAKVFFAKGENLYQYDVESAQTTALAEGEVQGVMQISEDGSYVYFVAKGDLAGVAKSGQPNLYVSHGGVLRFIATLAEDDNYLGGEWSELEHQTDRSSVSPDGTRLAFVSEQSLTGYDNEQAEAGDCQKEYYEQTGQCREVYLYDASAGTLTCVSCNPSGARPAGPSSLGEAYYRAPEHQRRNFSEDGSRLFFQSADALVPHASDGQRNVYEYEGGHVYPISNVAGAYESFFLDASASGNDVFFGTADQLLPQDVDNRIDVYDARVGGGFPVSVAPPPCDNGDSCKPPPAPQPAVFGAPASATFSGAGNLAPAATPKSVVKPKAKQKQCMKGVRHECKKKPKTKHKSARKAARRKSRRS